MATFTTREAAVMLGLLTTEGDVVMRMIQKGDLEGGKVGNRWVVEGDSLQTYILDRMGVREIVAASQKAALLEAEILELREVAGGAHTPRAKQRRRAIRSEWELAQGRRVRGHVSRRVRWLVMERDGHRCIYCGATPSDEVRLVIDHRIPFADGGTSDPDNLVTACEDCNVGKQDSPLVE